MTILSRRDFLKKAAYAAGVVAISPILVACDQKAATTTSNAPTSFPDTSSLSITNTPEPLKKWCSAPYRHWVECSVLLKKVNGSL
jgi:hypothetical protein